MSVGGSEVYAGDEVCVAEASIGGDGLECVMPATLSHIQQPFRPTSRPPSQTLAWCPGGGHMKPGGKPVEGRTGARARDGGGRGKNTRSTPRQQTHKCVRLILDSPFLTRYGVPRNPSLRVRREEGWIFPWLS
ncbi:hypothetical protein Pmani_013284 [Petrolisthes manimaculis]|uniref:Uncharacterized protein n=1 Tax=Petrolisthes manimaculis TaxID=1843537 RepID=A0AAE1U9R5_9EUCA|nr:hypothetical protein Pmani_013284 [Petrolisthes manimaculis]